MRQRRRKIDRIRRVESDLDLTLRAFIPSETVYNAFIGAILDTVMDGIVKLNKRELEDLEKITDGAKGYIKNQHQKAGEKS